MFLPSGKLFPRSLAVAFVFYSSLVSYVIFSEHPFQVTQSNIASPIPTITVHYMTSLVLVLFRVINASKIILLVYCYLSLLSPSNLTSLLLPDCKFQEAGALPIPVIAIEVAPIKTPGSLQQVSKYLLNN